ncbi:MAG: transposase [Planctomycetes bacterium]|nr:transposase [Planctomycetota bacterium]
MGKTRLRRTDPEKERYWRGVVRGQGGSGQSVREYCRQVGVKESAFYWWRKELARRSETRPVRGRKAVRSSVADGSERSGESNRRQKPRRGKPTTATPLGGRSPGNDASPFVPIHLLSGNSMVNAAALEIHLGDGRMVRVGPGVDRQTLVEVLRALEVRSC